MIITREDNGQLVKVLSDFKNGRYGFHTLFGFISESDSERRLNSRKRRGYLDTRLDWNFQFDIEEKDKKFVFKAIENCEIAPENENSWKIVTDKVSYLITAKNHATASPHFAEDAHDYDDISKSFLISILFVFLIFIGLYFSAQNVTEEVKPKQPITVKMVEMKHEIVKISAPKVVEKKVVTQEQKAHRAIQQNLGFLGLLGKKTLTKAVGGMPIKLKNVSAGAGKGGDAGSGGELLVGLGKAVKRTTVGNTGTKGLGGINTKGAGGGAGGYGTTSIASGEGVGISAVAISNDVSVEGGLSRGVIMATIQKYLAQIKACYNQGLKTNPGLEGTVTMDFRITGSGSVDYAKVAKSSLGSTPVESCMSQKMMGWQFPKPKGGVSQDVRFPFSLRPESI